MKAARARLVDDGAEWSGGHRQQATSKLTATVRWVESSSATGPTSSRCLGRRLGLSSVPPRFLMPGRWDGLETHSTSALCQGVELSQSLDLHFDVSKGSIALAKP